MCVTGDLKEETLFKGKIGKCCPIRIAFCRVLRKLPISSDANANFSHEVNNIARRAGCTLFTVIYKYLFELHIHYF